MSYAVLFSPAAETDLIEIELYLSSRFSDRNAAHYIQRIVTYCRSLSLAPYRGTQRDDIRPGLRTTGFERRVTILFEVQEEAVLILGILYGGRSFDTLS